MAIKQLEENNEEDEEICCLYSTLIEQEKINQHLFARLDLVEKRLAIIRRETFIQENGKNKKR